MGSHSFEEIVQGLGDERLILSRSTVHLETVTLEIITLEQFAERMQVGETTVWKWIRSGRLQPGRHYIQIERVIRFHWCRRLLERLHEDCSPNDSGDSAAPTTSEEAPQERRKNRYGKRINFDQ
ncbi:helix-turn-helix domain-containing protein [Geomonas sp. Red32]|uniref:helix-turn-helix domain-containing protein n=1 Tax=Geomonas sp. Red32 TaxID=2912856 RepID=UPI00202CE1C1|nr:helix-turn-helix domain-containing protein [Geomonas sp. Red32]MCM0082971.1 helix-turn-helix domain-containing protein [Geomonas sp. Red32]